MATAKPSLGEVWFVALDPTQGREQAGTRPALVVSVDEFNHGPAELALVVPITNREKGIALHVPIEPPEGGWNVRSFAKPEDLRSVSTGRLVKRSGSVAPETLEKVRDRLRILMDL